MSGPRPPIEGLPKQQEWKVLAVREGAEEPGQKGGTLKKFYVDFEGCDDVYWRRKMPAQVEVGRTYFGTISNGDYGPIFKKESPGGAGGHGGGSGGGSSRGGGRSFKPESEFDPEKVARMGRAHAQEMALTWLDAIGDMPNELADLWPFVDAFEADVNAAGAKAKAAAPPPAAQPQQQSPPPEPQPVDETTIRNLCEHAGLDQAPADRLTTFVCSRLKPEQQQRAKNGLERETADTLAQLASAFEQAEGFPLKEEDDIPF
jgi:hypothetical protein